MNEKVYNFETELNWNLMKIISQIDRFDASWSAIERKEGKTLRELKTIATIQSVGASTRIEGSNMSDEEVETLLNNIDITKLRERDAQEVVGYFNVMDLITDSFTDIEITENNLKNLHNQVLKYSSKDEWHRGNYKQLANSVEAKFADGSRQVIFRTAEPGFATDDAICRLLEWYHSEDEVHHLVKSAAFVYDFLSIHPFQDGNGRLSRLLTTLLLLKSGYKWIQYVSFEHEIEQNKKNYYRCLRNCQSQRPNEDITEWVHFFLFSLINIQKKLTKKLEINRKANRLSPKSNLIYRYIAAHPNCGSGEIATELSIPNPTVKRILAKLRDVDLIHKLGKGRSTNYLVK